MLFMPKSWDFNSNANGAKLETLSQMCIDKCFL